MLYLYLYTGWEVDQVTDIYTNWNTVHFYALQTHHWCKVSLFSEQICYRIPPTNEFLFKICKVEKD